ncbi:MAG: hypothetical protein RID53_19465 [Coleofasciculus sp. B1-GNL1-01]|uniref:hypothetical protein n=1 Tax=Coleofasciculus sp. B1-GNL1-01 TaxID=3068484 RepID=UPI0032F471D9
MDESQLHRVTTSAQIKGYRWALSCHAFKLGMGSEQDARTERDFAIIDIKV